MLCLTGLSALFSASHIPFSRTVSFGDFSCCADFARALAARMNFSVLSLPSTNFFKKITTRNYRPWLRLHEINGSPHIIELGFRRSYVHTYGERLQFRLFTTKNLKRSFSGVSTTAKILSQSQPPNQTNGLNLLLSMVEEKL